ncbi:MAG: hypothetical protein Q7O66_18135 [Dehalococcoidia bacterium]|nr:hypothetical protein [Dehalococcoidia bacterium]
MSRDLTPIRLLIVVAIFALIAQELLIASYTVDDAFISFRYARNLVEGNGLVFNLGERVEGYTNFLWTILLAGAILLRANPEIVSKGLGIIASAGTVYLVYRISLLTRPADSPWPLSLVAVAALTANGAFATSAISGLETGLFTFLVMAGAYVMIRCEFRQTNREPADAHSGLVRWGALTLHKADWRDLCPLFFALAALARPEGLVVFGVSVALKALSRGFERDDLKLCVRWIAVFAALYVPYFIWRLTYYGDLLPNTFYAKTGAGLAQYYNGLLDLRDFSLTYLGVVFLLALFVLARRKAPFWLTYITGMAMTFVLLHVYEGGDWIPFFRFLVPALPFYYLVIQEAVRILYPGIRSRVDGPAVNPGFGIACLALVGLTAIPSFAMYGQLARAARGQEMAHAALGSWLRDNRQGPVALMDIGRIGYLSRLPIIDTSGLTDRTIAHSDGGLVDKKFDLAYVLDRQPQYFVLASTTDFGESNAGPTDFPIERRIYEDKRFHERYAYQFTLDWGTVVEGKGYYLMVYERK